jgi:hypothetical protein
MSKQSMCLHALNMLIAPCLHPLNTYSAVKQRRLEHELNRCSALK